MPTYTHISYNLQKDKEDVIFIGSAADFPKAINGVRTLEANKTYFLGDNIDLAGDRLVLADNTSIMGASSENCSLTSTGLSASAYLITTNYTFPLQNVTIKDVTKAISINPNDDADQPIALDWIGVNFSGCTTNVYCNSIDNFIFTNGAILGSGSLVFNGTINTIGISGSIFTGDGTAYNIVELTENCVVNRRFRIIYSSMVAASDTVAIDVNASATIPTEGYILDTVNFSGGGTYLSGITHTSNDSLFINCKGITNTSVNGQMYMQDNATATTVSSGNTWYKVSGTTSASSDNQKYTHASNKLTNAAEIERKYLIQCTLSFNSTAGNVCKFGFYDSKLGDVRTPSQTKSTANAAGRAESVTLQCVVQHGLGDYIEIHCQNTSAANDITVTDMNVVITEFV